MRKTFVTILLFLTLSVTLVATEEVPVSAQDLPMMYVLNPLTENANFTFQTSLTPVGYHFNATVWVKDVTDLFGYQVGLQVNDTVLNITRAWLPSWDPQWVFTGKPATMKPKPALHDEPPGEPPDGYIYEAWVGDQMYAPSTPFDGDGLLAILEFEILLAPPEKGKVLTDLMIDYVDTYLLDSSSGEIPTEKRNGLYEYIWAPPLLQLEVKPSNYTAVELERFNMTVWLNNVAASKRLVSLEFNLRYNATLLNPIQVIEGPYMTELNLTRFGFTFDYFFNAGNVTIKHYMNPPYANFPEGSGKIATITFQGIYQGFYPEEDSCSLEFLDIKFWNDSEEPITPIGRAINGFYKILPTRNSYITIDVAPTSAEVNSNVTLSGTIKPSKVGVNVTIYYRLVNQSWASLTTVQTGAKSNYTYIWTTSDAGTFELKANWTGNPLTTYPAESDIATLIVRKLASAISIDVNPTMVTVGANVTISGTLNVTRSDVNVTIHYRIASGTWNTLATPKTDTYNNYTFKWPTTGEGDYEIKASWAGDASTNPAESEIKAVTIRAKPSSIGFTLYAAIGAGIAILIAIAIVAIYFLKIKKAKLAT